MTIIDALNNAEGKLAEAGIETARLDAEVLLANILTTSRSDLYTVGDKQISETDLARFNQAVTEREDRCPIAYITGQKEFWSLPIRVSRDVMIPRPDTETVVEEALRIVGDPSRHLKILDLCTGSGCIACALAKELPYSNITATDISEPALKVAGSNLLFAGDRIEILRSDLFSTFKENAGTHPSFDIIVTNPPYIPENDREHLPRDIADFEPHTALFGGISGLDFILRIIEEAHLFLVPGGSLIMEIGAGQAPECTLTALGHGGYDTISTAKDFAGIERVVALRKNIY